MKPTDIKINLKEIVELLDHNSCSYIFHPDKILQEIENSLL